MNRVVTSHLFAQPSFLEGMARVLDIGSTLQIYNDSSSDTAADIEAIKSDWNVVGKDLSASIQSHEQQPSATQ